MSRDSTTKILTVAFLLCVVCSILVSAAAVVLSDRQERNKAEEKKRNILLAAGLYDPAQPVAAQFDNIEARIVDLAQGAFAPEIESPRVI